MKTLSLREPWASLIAYGPKRIETRSWRTNYRGPLCIHASASRLTQAQKNSPHIRELLALIPGRELSYGLVLCTCRLAGCRLMDAEFLSSLTEPVERMCGEYAPGRWAWMLEDVRPIEAFPAKGMLGLWELPGL